MGGKRVVAPDGREWVVRRRWIGRRVKVRPERDWSGSGDAFSAPDWLAADDVGPYLAAFVAIVFLAFLFIAVIPLIALAIELVIAAILLLAGLFGRVVLRKPWRIEATAGLGRGHAWHVFGWRRSGRAMSEIAERLAARGELGSVEGATLLAQQRRIAAS